MQENNKTLIAKDWIQKLANGINPLDGSVIPDSDIVNNVHISRCLFYVAEILDAAVKKVGRKSKEYELDFNISPEDLAKVNIEEKTCISNFVKEINKFVPENMKPMSYGKILSWLIANGYIEEVEIDNLGKKKKPTASGCSIGISAELREGTSGPYWAVVYNPNAQRFILNNIYAIAES